MGSFYSTSKHSTATKTNIAVTRDRMQTVNILIVVTLSLSCLASPAPQPQEVADSSEVELIPPFDSGDGDGEEAGKPVVVVVRPTSFGDVFAGFPGFGRFPGFNSFPRLGDNHPHISLDEIWWRPGGVSDSSIRIKLWSPLRCSRLWRDIWECLKMMRESRAKCSTMMKTQRSMIITLKHTVKRFLLMVQF